MCSREFGAFPDSAPEFFNYVAIINIPPTISAILVAAEARPRHAQAFGLGRYRKTPATDSDETRMVPMPMAREIRFSAMKNAIKLLVGPKLQ